MTDDLPVDQIFGMKDRKTWNTVETRSRKIEIIADANYIGIGIVCVNDRVCVSSISIIGNPDGIGALYPVPGTLFVREESKEQSAKR